MRIAVVSERAKGRGASEASWNLALALQQADNDVGYFFAEESSEAEQAFALAIQIGSWRRSNRAIRSMRSLEPGSRRWFDEHLLRREELAETRRSLLDALENFRPDVVHFHNVGAIGGHPLVSSVRRRWPALWTAHDRYPFELFHNQWEVDGEQFTTWEYSPSERPSSVAFEMFKSLPLPCRVLTPSRWLSSIAAERLEGSVHPIEVVPNLIPSADAVPSSNLAGMLDVDMVALTVISQPSYALKGFDVVAEAVRMANRELDASESKLALVVATSERLGLTADGIYALHDLYRMGMFGRSGYLNRDEMASLYSSCDLLVLPSFIENMPNVVIEAAAAGIPAIASNVGGVPEVVKDGDTGWLVSAGDALGLASALVSAATKPDERERLGQNAKQQYLSRFCPEVVIETHLDCYRRSMRSASDDVLLGSDGPYLDVGESKFGPRRHYSTPVWHSSIRFFRRSVGYVLRRLRSRR